MNKNESRLRALLLKGPIGQIEAMLEEYDMQAHTRIALICHPHPLFGGTMHNKVVHQIAATLHQLEFATLRFNFRGVGQSQGVHDHGQGETDDAAYLLDYLKNRHPHATRVVLAGFSFGCFVATQLMHQIHTGLRTEIKSNNIDVWELLLVSPAVNKMDFSALSQLNVNKICIQGESDDICESQYLKAQYPNFKDPKSLTLIQGANHFYQQLLPQLGAAISHGICS